MKKIISFFLDCLSFDGPKAIVFNITTIILILTLVPTSFLETIPIHCVFKTFLIPLFFGGVCPSSGFFADCECPACGLTRGVSSLLHGDLSSAISYNIMSIPLLVLMVGLIGLNVWKIKN